MNQHMSPVCLWKLSLLGSLALASAGIAATPKAVDAAASSPADASAAAHWGPADFLALGETSPPPSIPLAVPLAQPTAPSAPPVAAPLASPAPAPTAVPTVQQPPVAPTVTPAAANQLTTLTLIPTSSSRVAADGRTRITLTGQLTGSGGAPFGGEATVTLTTTGGKFIGVDQDADRPGFQLTARNGEFTIELQSGTTPQKVEIRAAVDGRKDVKPAEATATLPAAGFGRPHSTPVEAYTQVEFTTNLRRPIVAGSLNFRLGGQGTDYFGSFSNYLNPDLGGTSLEFDAKIFATGKIGDWLITGAYNNNRSLNEDCSGATRLFRADQTCDSVYPVYGDSSTSEYLTPSIDSLFLKLERTSPVPGAGSDYAMWGDFKSAEFANKSQLYSATDRQLHGFKANYNFGDLQATLIYGNNLEGFQRDTIAPNGTSGYYFVSRRLVLGGSENVFIETEELGRPGSVIERISLSRDRDYEIDYDRGAILFRRPVLSSEFDLFGRSLVRRIVVTYQYDGAGNGGTNLYAGRLQYNFSRATNQESWIAGSYLREDRGVRDFTLKGIDALFSFGPNSQIIAEYAQSQNASVYADQIFGHAYRIEAKSQINPSLAALAYYRSVDEGFANNATLSFSPGQTRYGAELAAKLGVNTQAQVRIDKEVNYGTAAAVRTGYDALFNPGTDAVPGAPINNSLTTFSAGVQQKIGLATFGVDWVQRSRADRVLPEQLNEDSQQLVSRFTMPITPGLSVRAQNELSLGSQSDPLYPARTTVGLDWKTFPGVTVRLAQQWLSGGDFGTRSITSLDTIADYKLTENTDITSRYSILSGVNGMSSQGALGLNHRWVVAPGFRVNLGYERIVGNALTYSAAGQQFVQPYAVGQSAASLGLVGGDSYNIGFEYTDNPGFKASGRYERRNSSAGNNTVWSTAIAGKLTPALTTLLRFQQANYANQTLVGAGLGDTRTLKVGLAFRDPHNDKFNSLLSYEFRQNPNITPTTLLFGSGTGSKAHQLAWEAIYSPDYRWEFYGKFALRSTQSYLASDLISKNTITLSQFRTTYRFGYNWDVAADLRWIHQTNTGFDEWGTLLELGYYLTPNLRLAAGYSFGSSQNVDFDGNSRTRGGPYLGFSVKLNDLFGFGVQPIAPRQQPESTVKPAPTKPSIQNDQWNAAIAPEGGQK
jgi:hypothetical protein